MSLPFAPALLAPALFVAAFLLGYYGRRALCAWRDRRRQRLAQRRLAALQRYRALRQPPPDAPPPSD